MLPRGFKSQCERRSVEIRKTLGLKTISPLNARELAKTLDVVAWAESDIEGLSVEDIEQLTVADSECWSAFTLRHKAKNLIVYNSAQSKPRINSVLMHELSHIILGHQLATVSKSDDGFMVPKNYDQDQEDEANWLAGTLLLPRPALLHIRSNGIGNSKAMEQFLVSQQMFNWRIRMTGVDYQLTNSRKKLI